MRPFLNKQTEVWRSVTDSEVSPSPLPVLEADRSTVHKPEQQKLEVKGQKRRRQRRWEV